MFVDVDGAFLIAEQKLGVAEAKHAERSLAREARGDGCDVRLFEVGDGPGLFFVEGEDFETAGGGDCEGGVEEVYAEAFGWDVEVVVVAEEFGCAFSREAGFLLG